MSIVARRALLLAPALCALCFQADASAGLVATYQFQNSLAADQAGAPALTPINSGAFVSDTVLGRTRTVYQRYSETNAPASQSALRLDTAPLSLTSNNYAVEIVFTFTDNISGNGWRRVVNSSDPSSMTEPGLHVDATNRLNIWQGIGHAGGFSLSLSAYHHVVLSVSPLGEKAYLNGALAVNYAASTPDAIATHYLSFFQDNGFEYANGRVALIRVFDAALSASEVSDLYNGGDPFPASSVPEPSTILTAMLSCVFGIGAALRRRSGSSRVA
ncbi:MAG: LamG-like jellyroll fold domain-containing protein [Isosphaeraceae bacterium]|nr:LamG-like jellyroll fold domain-containing protein [Isosphaeraceae bacterium]